MAQRPIWEGHLRLSLVTCPVRLYKAVGEGEGAVHFNLLHRKTMHRVKQQYRDTAGGVVERKDLVRGFAIEPDKYVVVEDAELAKLKLESTKVIDIERFVEAKSIDRLYWDQPYYLVPEGKTAQEPYAVIRTAMEGGGQVALGRLVMVQRERIVAIEPRGPGLLLTTLRSHDEVRDDEEAFDDIARVKVDTKMVEIAKQIIAQSHGPFEPAEFRDRYEDAVRELVESKRGGAKDVPEPEEAPRGGNVVDLMEALRRSLKGAPATKEPAAKEKKPTKKKAAPAPKKAAGPRRKAG